MGRKEGTTAALPSRTQQAAVRPCSTQSCLVPRPGVVSRWARPTHPERGIWNVVAVEFCLAVPRSAKASPACCTNVTLSRSDAALPSGRAVTERYPSEVPPSAGGGESRYLQWQWRHGVVARQRQQHLSKGAREGKHQREHAVDIAGVGTAAGASARRRMHPGHAHSLLVTQRSKASVPQRIAGLTRSLRRIPPGRAGARSSG